MKKNSQIHILIETSVLEKLKHEALEADVSLSELCRQKLKENTQLTRIEMMLKNLALDSKLCL